MVFIEIESEKCSGCGACFSVCKNVFQTDAGRNSRLVDQYQGESEYMGEIPASLQQCAKNAADSCPNNAINIG